MGSGEDLIDFHWKRRFGGSQNQPETSKLRAVAFPQ